MRLHSILDDVLSWSEELVEKELKPGMLGTDAALTHTILHTHTAHFKLISKVHDRNATQMGAADFPPKITNPNII
jgi:hypothetical protein